MREIEQPGLLYSDRVSGVMVHNIVFESDPFNIDGPEIVALKS